MLRTPLSKLWQRVNLEQVNTNSPDSHGGFTPVVMPIWNIYTISSSPNVALSPSTIRAAAKTNEIYDRSL